MEPEKPKPSIVLNPSAEPIYQDVGILDYIGFGGIILLGIPIALIALVLFSPFILVGWLAVKAGLFDSKTRVTGTWG